MSRTISIGTEAFYELREESAFLVDKTEFLKEWWNGKAKVTLITRPRRFGKTLTMSMVECFFSTRFAGRSDLFEGLKVWEDEEFRKLQGTIPVINISLKNAKCASYDMMQSALGREISKVYVKYGCLLKSDRLSEKQKGRISEMADLAEDMPEKKIRGAIEDLSRLLYQHYGQKPIILIDEYDAPLLSAYLNGYFDQAIELIRGIFASALKTNDYLGRAILTGITRITKESLFSDLNNMVTAGMLDNAYSDSLGFTEEEVEAALVEFGLSGKKDEVRRWYDGYTIGNQTGIYNPWSIINFLSTMGGFEQYWSLTSGNDLIRQLLMDGNQTMKMRFEELLQGRQVYVEVSKNVVFQELDMKNNEKAVWTLMLSTGYLRVMEQESVWGAGIRCRVKATNYEIWGALQYIVRYWFDERSENYNVFVKALLSNDLENMNKYLSLVLLNCMSYHDGGRNTGEEKIKDRPDRRTPENFYHGLVLGMLVDLQGRYVLTSNRESGNGRYDIMLEPIERVGWQGQSGEAGQTGETEQTGQTGQVFCPEPSPSVLASGENSRKRTLPAYIIEFKVQNETTEKSLEETADHALKQIEEKAYETVLLAKGFSKENIYKYGMAFNGKAAYVKLGE